MRFENNQNYSNLNKKKLESQKIIKNPGKENAASMSRRDFLKQAGGLAAIIGAGASIWKLADRFADKKIEDKEDKAANEDNEGQIEEQQASFEQEKIYQQDIKSIYQILDFNQPGQIELNAFTLSKLKNHVKEQYRHNPKFKNSLIDGYRKMGNWLPYLNDIFARAGVPQEYVFLALPESHWNPQAVSRCDAVGPYQFMPGTAKDYGLKIDSGLDERKDPLKSAEACALFLKHLYKIFGDWNMALSGYNGGFVKRYLEKAKTENQTPSYSGFMGFIETRVNNLRDDIKNKSVSQAEKEVLWQDKIRDYSENLNYPAKYLAIKELIDEGFVKERAPKVEFYEISVHQPKTTFQYYKVKAGDTMNKLLHKYGQPAEELIRYNPDISSKGLRQGQPLKIPDKVKALTMTHIALDKGILLNQLSGLNPGLEAGVAIPDGCRIRIPKSGIRLAKP